MWAVTAYGHTMFQRCGIRSGAGLEPCPAPEARLAHTHGLMTHLQRYFFRQVFWPLIVAGAALTGLALLTQSLSSISLLVDEHQGALLFLYVTLLALPQLLSLVLPIALFIAVIYALHRLHTESELTVASASGMSRWGVMTPVMRLTVLAVLIHLVLNLWVQPYAYREMRRTLHNAQADLAASLIRPGEFVQPSNDLTLYVQSIESGGRLSGLMIEDAREPEQPVVYMAETGRLLQSSGSPSIVLENGNIQQLEEDGRLSYLDFDSYPFDLGRFVETQGNLVYKLTDRYLHELFFPDLSNPWEWSNRDAMAAEGHGRLAMPLHDIAIVLIAILALIGGDFSRTGYGRRIWIAAAAALTVRLLGFAAQSAAAEAPELNVFQYLLPVGAGAAALALLLNPRRRAPRPRAIARAA